MSGAQVKATIGSGPLRGVVCVRGAARSHVDAIAWNARQRPDRFHASRRALPLHSARKGFGKCWRLILAVPWSLILVIFLVVTEYHKLNLNDVGFLQVYVASLSPRTHHNARSGA